jgi:prolyl oligopeptidase
MFSKPVVASATLTALLALGACTTLPGAEREEPAVQQTAEAQPVAEDPFLWMEEVLGERALAWVRSQNERSLAVLEGDPRFAGLREDALAIVRARDRLTFGSYSDGYVSNFWQDASHVRGIWRRAVFDGWMAGSPQWETVLDMDALAASEGKNWVYQGANCLDVTKPWDTTCLLSLSDGGKDARVVREWHIGQRAFVAGGFDLPEAKSDVTWLDADTVLVATDWGNGTLTESGYPFVVKKLKRGQSLSQAEELFRGEVRDVAAGSFRLFDGVRQHHFFSRTPTFFTSETHHLRADGSVAKLALPARHSIVGLRDGWLYFSIQQDWQPTASAPVIKSGSLMRAPLAALGAADVSGGEVIYTPGPREALQGASLTRSGVYVTISQNVKSQVRRYSNAAGGWSFTTIGLPANGVASVADADIRDDRVFFSYNDMVTPPSVLLAETPEQAPQVVQAQPARFDASDLEVHQHEAVSKDGTRVPYFIVHKKGIRLNGETPTLLYGYGGFEVSMEPTYGSYTGKLWLERGGAYVLANIRGGGEFGPEWHQAGLKGKRQVIFDDFIAVAEDLIARRITSPRRLGAMGGSNGGLLMGVMLNQRPDLFNAVVVQVPLLDMLRYDQLLAGASWVEEYGDPDNPAERPFLEQMSPYQNLRARPDFPEPFFVTSTKDDRVHPAHARKFAAKMESLGMPFLYYENIDGGHSAAANLVEGARRRALEWTYLTRKLMD